MEYINTGANNNFEDADSLLEAFTKINKNFSEYNLPLKKIVWNSLEDNLTAFKDINSNFKVIQDNGKPSK